MPGYDRTGPQGRGQMTGGARGFCNPAGAFYGQAYGRGFGPGGGRGFRRGSGPGPGRGAGYRGRGRRWFQPGYGGYGADYVDRYAMTPEEELNMLRDDANGIKSELDAINRRIEELESRSS